MIVCIITAGIPYSFVSIYISVLPYSVYVCCKYYMASNFLYTMLALIRISKNETPNIEDDQKSWNSLLREFQLCAPNLNFQSVTPFYQYLLKYA